MKKNMLSVALGAAMLLSGCNLNETGEISSYSNSISGTDNSGDLSSYQDSGSETDDPEERLARNFPPYEEVSAQYPGKTVLVWAIEETGYDRHAPFHTRKVNEYLDEQGCGLAVCFTPVKVDDFIDEPYPDQFSVETEKLLNKGERIDIISPLNCREFVFNNMFEPLDGYLNTDIGHELYGAFPEKLWESLRINGSIYGISGDAECVLSPDRGYFINAELAEKYGYDVTKPVLEQLDILKAVNENEKNVDVFAAYLKIDRIVPFVNVKAVSSVVYWNGDTHSAELSTDNPQYIEWLRLYDTLIKEDLLKNIDIKRSDSFFIRSDAVSGGGIGYADMKPVEVDYFGNSVTAIPVFNTKTMIRSAGAATGICSKSENKEAAFELLAKVFTDPVLNNLLVYGVEGENYTLENGIVKEIESPTGTNVFNINPFNTYRFANHMICHRSEDNLFTPEQYADIFENAGVYEDIDFALDPRGIMSELNAEYFASNKLLLSETTSLDDVLSEYREGLYAAGVQKIIDESNRQYEVYKNEKD